LRGGYRDENQYRWNDLYSCAWQQTSSSMTTVGHRRPRRSEPDHGDWRCVCPRWTVAF